MDKEIKYTLKGVAYCDKPKCKCGVKKAWNITDVECGIYRAHGNGIITAKNRARGKYN